MIAAEIVGKLALQSRQAEVIGAQGGCSRHDDTEEDRRGANISAPLTRAESADTAAPQSKTTTSASRL